MELDTLQETITEGKVYSAPILKEFGNIRDVTQGATGQSADFGTSKGVLMIDPDSGT